jgi:hypothetical protein
MRAENKQNHCRASKGLAVLAPPAEILPEPVPVWLAVLLAARCQAMVNGQERAVRWNHVQGRALYTNAGVDPELIQPLGVQLERGQTVAVSWIPGETAYTVEVYRHYDLCA